MCVLGFEDYYYKSIKRKGGGETGCVCVCVCVSKDNAKTSLVVQWLRIHLEMLGTWFNPWSGKIPHTMEELSPCATTTEPALYGLLLLLLLSHFSWVQLCATP